VSKLLGQISTVELAIMGYRDQAKILRKRGADGLAVQAEFRVRQFTEIKQTLEWLQRHETTIRAAISAGSKTDVE
jgi:hypothetical protein